MLVVCQIVFFNIFKYTDKKFFGITAESVYCDDYGLATSNSKLNYYNKTIDTVFSYDIFNDKIQNTPCLQYLS